MGFSGPVCWVRQGAFLHVCVLTWSDQKAADPGRVLFLTLQQNSLHSRELGNKARFEDKGQGFRVQGPFAKGQAFCANPKFA